MREGSGARGDHTDFLVLVNSIGLVSFLAELMSGL